MNSETVPMVPASIISTLKSMAPASRSRGRTPLTRKTAALVSATQGRYLGREIMRT